MEWFLLISLGLVVVVAILNTERQSANIIRNVDRVERKLNLVLKQMNIAYGEIAVLSDRVKELARVPSRKIQAIKVYQEETGAGLREAKDAIEAFIDSLER
jgi:ribosomal protein L7/L12